MNMCNYMGVKKMMVRAFYAMSFGVIINYNLIMIVLSIVIKLEK